MTKRNTRLTAAEKMAIHKSVAQNEMWKTLRTAIGLHGVDFHGDLVALEAAIHRHLTDELAEAFRHGVTTERQRIAHEIITARADKIVADAILNRTPVANGKEA